MQKGNRRSWKEKEEACSVWVSTSSRSEDCGRSLRWILFIRVWATVLLGFLFRCGISQLQLLDFFISYLCSENQIHILLSRLWDLVFSKSCHICPFESRFHLLSVAYKLTCIRVVAHQWLLHPTSLIVYLWSTFTCSVEWFFPRQSDMSGRVNPRDNLWGVWPLEINLFCSCFW